jgi:protein-S-isoprenylcysteine O-methyltransferase Ste14
MPEFTRSAEKNRSPFFGLLELHKMSACQMLNRSTNLERLSRHSWSIWILNDQVGLHSSMSDSTGWNARGEFFVIGQFVLLGLIFLLPVFPMFAFPTSSIGTVLKYLGFALLVLAGLNLGRNLTPLPKPKSDARLVTTGIFAWMRHPIYTALMLLTFGTALERGDMITLILSTCLTVLLEFKSRREEIWLLEQFPEYAAYRVRVKKFLPGIY